MSSENGKKIGVTHAIRQRLNFNDERLWKKFSARRLELIDTLDLSLKKASDQEIEIKRVAETLRNEFKYDNSYSADFDKLVRAAVQSVRRNRKRSSKKGYADENQDDQIAPPPKKKSKSYENSNDTSFLNNVLHNEDEVYDINYSKSKKFTINDHAKDTIDNIVRPRLPPIGSISMTSSKSINTIQNEMEEFKIDCNLAKSIIINKIERSKTCNESDLTCKSENLQFLGKSIMSSCIGFTFEKSFAMLNRQSIQYLRNKLNGDKSIANFFRILEEFKTNSIVHVSDEIAITSLYTILGGLAVDYGFKEIMYLVCEILYVTVLHEYPLIVKNSIPFKAQDYLKQDLKENYSNKTATAFDAGDGIDSLNRLAEVATNLQTNSNGISTTNSSKEGSPSLSINKKRVLLKFFNQVIEFFYPMKFQATPKYFELVENVKQVFNLNDHCLIIIKNDNKIVQTDFEIEKIFKNVEHTIEFDILVQNSIPIYEINQKDINGKISLPPPIIHQQEQRFKFLSNSEETKKLIKVSSSRSSSPLPPPPPPMLPKFQPLL